MFKEFTKKVFIASFSTNLLPNLFGSKPKYLLGDNFTKIAYKYLNFLSDQDTDWLILRNILNEMYEDSVNKFDCLYPKDIINRRSVNKLWIDL